MTLAISAGSFLRPSETFLFHHATELAPGHTVLLCHDGRGTGQPDVPVYRYRAPRFTGLGWAGRLPNALLRRAIPGIAVTMGPHDLTAAGDFLREHEVSTVLAEYGAEGVFLAPLCERHKLPLYVHFHGFDASSQLRSKRYVGHFRQMFDKVEGVIAPSRYLADNLAAIGCPRGKLHVNPYGVDITRFTPAAPEPGRIVAVGRLVPKKAPHLTIRAFAAAARNNPQATLEMLGDGPLRGQCEAEIERLGLGGRVSLAGAVDHADVVKAMSRAAIFVQHSVVAPDGDTEGLPVAILEAMSTALPVVSTRHSGIPEAVEDGETGILVDEHDHKAMGQALDALLADPDRAAAMGAAGRARVERHFSRERSIETLRGILQI